jgi:hypothetical protein
MSGPPYPAAVRLSASATTDDACVIALDREGATVGRAQLSRLYGCRGEVHLELAPTDEIALALVAALEANAAAHGLAQLELEPGGVPADVVAALRRARRAHDEVRGTGSRLIWQTSDTAPIP